MAVGDPQIELMKASEWDFEFQFWVGNQWEDLSESLGSMPHGFDFRDRTTWPIEVTDWSAYGGSNVTQYISSMSFNTYKASDTVGRWDASLGLYDWPYNSEDSRGTSIIARLRIKARMADGSSLTPIWGPWGLFFLGWISDISPISNYEGCSMTMNVGGMMQYLDLAFLEPITWGRDNIALGKEVSMSTTLADPTNLINTGEFSGTRVSLGADNAVDGQLWGAPAASGDVPIGAGVVYGPDFKIREVYAKPPTGYSSDYQWVTVKSGNTAYGKPIGLVKDGVGWAYSIYHVTGGDDPPPPYCSEGWQAGPTGGAIPWSPKNPGTGLGVFCANRARVEELFDLSGAAWVVEWKSNPNFHLDEDDGWVALVVENDTEVSDFVAWSTTPGSWTKPDVWTKHHDSECSLGTWGWTGQPVDSNSWVDGRSLARQYYDSGLGKWKVGFDTDTKNDWLFNESPNPGHSIRGNDPEWFILKLGDIDCKVAVTFDPAIHTTMYLDTTYGLLYSGHAIVNAQVFSYTGRTATTLTGIVWEGTMSTIGVGNGVLQYDDNTAQTLHGWRLSHIDIVRRPMMTHIRAGQIFGSRATGDLMEPDAPAEDHWYEDWPVLGSSPNGYQLNPNHRAIATGILSVTFPYDVNNREKWRVYQLLFLCNEMMGNSYFYSASDPAYRADGGYFLINEIEVYPDDLQTGIDLLPNTSTAADVVRFMITQAGIPTDAIFVPTFSYPFKSQATSRASTTDIVSSLAKMYGLMLYERPDGTIQIINDPWYPNGYGSGFEFTLTPENISQVDERIGKENTYKQVRLSCRDPEGRMGFIGVYPYYYSGDTEPIYGDTYTNEGEIFVVADQSKADMAAQAVYHRLSMEMSATFTLVGAATWAHPFQIFNVNYWDRGVTGDVDGRPSVMWPTWVIEGVMHEVRFGGMSGEEKSWVTTIDAKAFNARMDSA